MLFRKVKKNGNICAVVESEDLVITDVQSAVDLLANAYYEIGTNNIAISKNLIKEDFFILSTRLCR